jgi:hypothetical protein
VLTDFFNLNGNPEDIITMTAESALTGHLRASKDLRDVIYFPESFAPELPKDKTIRKTHFENVSFSKTVISNVNFRSCTFKDCLFINTEFVGVEFHDCSFDCCNFIYSKFEEVYLDPAALAEAIKDKTKHANIGIKLFQALLANSRETHQSDFADKAEYYFRQYRRSYLPTALKRGELTKREYRVRSLKNALYEWMAGYGYRPLRMLPWLLLLIGLVSTINYALWNRLDLQWGDHCLYDPSFVQVVYFTVVILTTLGGDFMPWSDLGMMLIAAEAGLGVLMMGALVAVLVKRIVR